MKFPFNRFVLVFFVRFEAISEGQEESSIQRKSGFKIHVVIFNVFTPLFSGEAQIIQRKERT